ncbi:MAG: PKD domain-containing protein [Bacteroidales bacterium]|nr:PKD domain-containing protein [Bacteroidales bacterium]
MNIEQFFQEGLSEHAIKPSASVIRRIRFKLFLGDIIHLRQAKINIALLLITLAGISVPLYYSVARNKFPNLTNSAPLDNQPDIITSTNILPLPGNTDEGLVTGMKTDDGGTAELPAPVASFSASALTGCAPCQVYFENSSSNGENFLWDFGNGQTSTLRNPSTNYTKPGIYNISLTVTNKNGTAGKSTKPITIYNAPVAKGSINIEKSKTESRQVSFLNSSANSDSYLWSFGDNSSSTDENPQHIYKNYGKYQVILIAYNNAGCSDTTIIENKFIESNYHLSFPPSFKLWPQGPQNDGYYEAAANQGFVFYPLNNGVAEYELKIFAPNNIEVFSTRNIKQGWNGYIKGKIAPSGVYSYTAKGVYPNGEGFNLKGTFSVNVEDLNSSY